MDNLFMTRILNLNNKAECAEICNLKVIDNKFQAQSTKELETE